MIPILVIIGVIGAVTAYFVLRSTKSSAAATTTTTPVANEFEQRTARGIRVLTEGGLPLAENKLNVIDEAFMNLVADASALGYTDSLDPHLYTIHVLTSSCTPNGEGVLSWLIRADDYDGSIYDKNPAPGIGEVLVAEQVIMNPLTNTPTFEYKICLADDDLMRNTVRFGAEHLILFKNSPERYQATANHATSGIAHPLLPSSRNL